MSKLKKSLSQNFLHDQKIIREIVSIMNIQEDDFVLEIGAGNGALTKELVKTKAKIVALEIDKTLNNSLEELRSGHSNFSFYIDDFRSFEIDSLHPPSSIKLVSNLPYHLTGIFLKKICLMHEMILTATLMVQKEVAERICALSGKKYGFLSVFVQFYADVKYQTTVFNTCFYPKPSVDSAIIQLTFKTPKLKNPDSFFSFVRKCFHAKRKKLLNCLKPYFDSLIIKQGFSNLNLDENIRAEMLSLDEFLNLYNFLNNNRLIQ